MCQKIYRCANLYGTPSNRKRTGRPPIFSEKEKERLRLFITQDRGTRRLTWEEIHDAMQYSCSPDLVRNTRMSVTKYKCLLVD